MDRSNVDTDQIIPKQFLKRIERTGFGQFAFFDWRYLDDGSDNPEFELNQPRYRGASILVTRRNFGCGSSREHAPVSLGAAGVAAVVAESYARIFFRNCIATGELYPLDTPTRLCDDLTTGMEAELDLDANRLTVPGLGRTYDLAPLGDARQVIDHGGLFAHARKTGMIQASADHTP